MILILMEIKGNGMKMWNAPALMPTDWLTYAKDTFDWLLAESVGRPRMMSLGVHLRIIGRPGRIVALDRFFQHVSRAEGVWIATRRDIAAHYQSIQSN